MSGHVFKTNSIYIKIVIKTSNSIAMGFSIVVTNNSHVKYADEICIMMSDAAIIRGTGIAKRSPSYIEKKMRIVDAIYAWIKFD